MIEKITDQNLERYDSRLKEWCDRKFFEKGNYGKYETTKEASAVTFYPAPNTTLEGKVKFVYKEIMPANGDKGPNNPSTIEGVSNITVTHCESEGVDSTNYTISFDNTYYGGEIDLATGVMTVTWKGYVFNGTENWNDNENHGTYYRYVLSITPNKNTTDIVCTHFIRANNLDYEVQHYTIAEAGISIFTTQTTLEEFKMWLASQYSSGTPVTACYALATPFTVQLTPTEILSLAQTDKYTPRVNTVYTDADSIQISYLKSPIRDEYEKTQAILSLGGNS